MVCALSLSASSPLFAAFIFLSRALATSGLQKLVDDDVNASSKLRAILSRWLCPAERVLRWSSFQCRRWTQYLDIMKCCKERGEWIGAAICDVEKCMPEAGEAEAGEFGAGASG